MYSNVRHLITLCVLITFSFGVSGCSTLPKLEARQSSQAISQEQAKQTQLGQALQSAIASNAPLSGVSLLAEPVNAFATRLHLIQQAEKSLDLQYYIWRDDITGRLLLGALEDAARRNVRIRLLLDDNGTHGLDEELYALAQYPQVEVRLFNPFYQRKYKILDFITDAKRVHRRMHNKAFIVDNQVAITGGRNIADEYFAANGGTIFADLDVMAVGPIVQETSQDFDRYWESAASYPITQLIQAPSPRRLEDLKRRLLLANQNPYSSDYRWQLAQSTEVQDILSGNYPWTWAKTDLVSDDPLKIFAAEDEAQAILPQLQKVLGMPETRLVLVSPYFIPGQSGVEAFAQMVEQGVSVKIYTNSFKATDVAIVHAGYKKYRKPLLERGIELVELREQGNPVAESENDEDDVNGETDQEQISSWMGSSGSSLHAKTFIVDGQRLFIGSFNFDPRSIHYNTEMGFVIEHPEIAQYLEQQIEDIVPNYAFRLKLDEDGHLQWLRQNADGSIETLTKEPDSTLLERILLEFFSLLPLDRVL
ncbi:hypothetical protein CWI83_07365 [Pseudidiomarina taiwanensis]|uniref:PLD phosphodiesterase domain-containing protein n=1 Tax=Pseudidiomarina taiwanensis TaxID=337250 RepID=A0A432ZFH9_9GAMM|nr:hypothetical protein CWI83_07365 [Pseudidiomarina taiwanensis]